MNPVLIGAKLNLKRSSLSDKEAELRTLLSKREELTNAVEGAESETDLDAIEQEINKLEEEIEALEVTKSGLEEEIEALENKLEESNKKPDDGSQRKMPKNIETRELINEYVRSKGKIEQRAGFTSVEGGALIPVEILSAKVVGTGTIDLAKLINVAKVNSGGGKFPVIKKSGSKMTSVAELAANPELQKPTITEVPFDIETYRGYIPVSQEVIDDADYDVVGLIADEIADQELNTKNAAIATVLKTATAKAVTGLDGLKEVFNKDIKRIYSPKAIVSASLYNALDTAKDKEGRYLLQDNIAMASGKSLFGKEVIVLDDTVIGAADGDLVGFIGDAKAFATLFDRKQVSVRWVDHNVYGQLLAGFVRFDCKAVDTDAGYYVTYTAAP